MATVTASATLLASAVGSVYLRDLGVDAIWLSPFYVSPQADAGYDVADYRDVDPVFGTLADFDRMLGRVVVTGTPEELKDGLTLFSGSCVTGVSDVAPTHDICHSSHNTS